WVEGTCEVRRPPRAGPTPHRHAGTVRPESVNYRSQPKRGSGSHPGPGPLATAARPPEGPSTPRPVRPSAAARPARSTNCLSPGHTSKELPMGPRRVQRSCAVALGFLTLVGVTTGAAAQGAPQPAAARGDS